jgi:hypothetical protein
MDMDDMLERVKSALSGTRENSSGQRATPLLDRMASMVSPVILAGMTVVALSQITPANAQYYGDNSPFSGSSIGRFLGLAPSQPQTPYGYQGNPGSIQTYRSDRNVQPGYGGGYQNGYAGGYQRPDPDGVFPGDRIYATRAAQAAHQGAINEPFSWYSPVTGNRGTFTVVDQGHLANGQVCKTLRTDEQYVGMPPRSDVRQFCMDRNGGWRPVLGALDVQGPSLAQAEPADASPNPRMG